MLQGMLDKLQVSDMFMEQAVSQKEYIVAKNETNNANLVREHYRTDAFTVKNAKGHAKAKQEEQSSTNEQVREILATASKKGNGNIGSPDFIFTFSQMKDFIVLIECKANNRDHASNDLVSNPVGKAVDGAIWYAKKFVESGKYRLVIAIGTSGESEEELKVSYYKVFRNTAGDVVHEELTTPTGEPINGLLSLEKTVDFAMPSAFEVRQKKYNKSRDNIHGIMRKASLSEENKPLVLAGSLLALSDRRFLSQYPDISAEDLGGDTLRAIGRYIRERNLLDDPDKQNKFMAPFSVIENHPQLHISTDTDKDNTYYKQILDELVRLGLHQEKHPDFIGDFYTEFLKYSGGDGKSLGIVLTPNHITRLFARLGFVNKKTVFMDTCFGTGAFLNSALQIALADAGDNEEEREKIFTQNVVGIELDPKMFTLGATNLLLRGVNIGNLFEGSCFDPEIVGKVKDLDRIPNVALINPPYSLRKNGGKAEIEFIEKACNIVTSGGYVVALVPVSTGSDTGAFATNVKERILRDHTLHAVMSMPLDLFSGKAGTIVQVLVFKTGTPHRNSKKTWFANWSDDGFFIKKHVGRGDYNGVWKHRETNWVSHYEERAVEAGYSTLREVGHKDEWVTEAYLANDYEKLTNSNFEANLKEFILYEMSNKKVETEETKTLPNMNEWKEFKFSDIFEVRSGDYKVSSTERPAGDIPLVSASQRNNGVSDYVAVENADATVYESGLITLAKNGSVGESFYQPDPFVATGDILVLKPKQELSKWSLIFIASVIKQQAKDRFNYGFKLNSARLKNFTLKLPANESGEDLDEKAMENYMKSLSWASYSQD